MMSDIYTERMRGELAAIALLGSVRGLHEDADILHRLIESRMADTSDYRLERILAQALGGDASYAIEAMTTALANDPDNDRCKVLMAMAMFAAGHPDAQFTLDNVLATSMDQQARAMAAHVAFIAPLLRYRRRVRDRRAWM